jgi:hypothetical protein
MKNTKTLTYRLAVLTAECLLLIINCPAQTGASDQDIVAKIDEYMNASTKSGLFMGSILVARDGKVLVTRGYGMANLEWNVPNTPQTKFDITQFSLRGISPIRHSLNQADTFAATEYLLRERARRDRWHWILKPGVGRRACVSAP